MTVIEEFIKEYKKQFDFYNELARIVYSKLEDEVIARGIKSIVTFRAKRPDRLHRKLDQRNSENQYSTIQDIRDDIVDLAGARVSLYFPSERNLIDEIIKDLFIIDKIKEFPNKSHKPKYEKRFSGYWATHYRIHLKKDEDIPERYNDTIVEIQVASLLMHSWSEVEHDLVYKPLSGNLSEEESSILDELNGLVLSGEIALERLHKAMTKRTESSKQVTNRYQLTNYIINNLNKNIKNDLKFGKTDFLNDFMDTYPNSFKTSNLKTFINKINNNSNESISDQLISMVLNESYHNEETKNNLILYLKSLEGSNQKQSGFESFIRTWIILEKAVLEISRDNNIRSRKYFIPDFTKLTQLKSLSENDKQELNRLRQVRNMLIHGIEQPSDSYLEKSQKKLKAITKKVIKELNDLEIVNQLLKEIEEI